MEEEAEKIGSLQGGSDQMRKGEVRECIECGGTMKITREYEARLYSHYGRPPYWLREAKRDAAALAAAS